MMFQLDGTVDDIHVKVILSGSQQTAVFYFEKAKVMLLK